MNEVTAEQALREIKSHQKVFVQGGAATPLYLLNEWTKLAHEVKDVEIIAMSMIGDIGINDLKYKENFFFRSLFVSPPIRNNVNGNNGDYIPVFLSEIHQLFERKIIDLDVALIHVSPPDKHGYCSLGMSVDVARSAVKHAKKVIAQVNPNMPRTHGDGLISVKEIDFLVPCNAALPVVDYRTKIGACERAIAQHVAALIEDGSTLQMGIGTIPDAVLACLDNHKDLGVHTEMFSNGIMDLMQKGVINNRLKHKHRFKTATAFAIGNQELYDFVDDNPSFVFLNASYVNDGYVIRSNPKVVAVNSAIEIDLTGQICADSIGMYQFSGVGGQMDFIRGAALSPGGKPIIAMPSISPKGISKITPMLNHGAGVVTTRAHAHYVVTENGVANLFGKTLKERAVALRDIAHDDHKEDLDKAIFERF